MGIRNYLILTSIFWSTLVLGASNQNTCESFFENIEGSDRYKVGFAEPKKGDIFKLQFHGDPNIQILKLKNIFEQNDKLAAEFTSLNENTSYRINPEDIARWIKLDPKTQYKLQSFKNFLMTSLEFSNLLLQPYKKINKNESFEIVGKITSNNKHAYQMSESIKSFDNSMKDLGFDLPKFTRVVLGGKYELDYGFGSYAFYGPIYNILNRKIPNATISMSNAGDFGKLITDRSILFHERTHTILHETYHPKAFISVNKMLQEAFADYFALYYLNTTFLAKVNENEYFRNIENKTSYMGSKVSNDLLKLQEEDYHNTSMHISNLLLSIQKSLGNNHMDTLIKKVLDDLNSFRDSYVEYLTQVEGKELKSVKKEVTYDFEYVLASIYKSTLNLKEKKDIQNKIKELCNSLNFSHERIIKISQKLKKSEIDYNSNPGLSFVDKAEPFVYGISGAILKAGEIILIISEINDFLNM